MLMYCISCEKNAEMDSFVVTNLHSFKMSFQHHVLLEDCNIDHWGVQYLEVRNGLQKNSMGHMHPNWLSILKPGFPFSYVLRMLKRWEADNDSEENGAGLKRYVCSSSDSETGSDSDQLPDSTWGFCRLQHVR